MLLPPQQCAGVDYRTGSAGFGRAQLSVFNKPPDPATRRPRPIIGLVELLALAVAGCSVLSSLDLYFGFVKL